MYSTWDFGFPLGFAVRDEAFRGVGGTRIKSCLQWSVTAPVRHDGPTTVPSLLGLTWRFRLIHGTAPSLREIIEGLNRISEASTPEMLNTHQGGRLFMSQPDCVDVASL